MSTTIIDDVDLDDLNLPAETSSVQGSMSGTRDPATFGFPPTLPVEIALKTAPVKDICAAYGISKEQWDILRHDPRFKQQLKKAMDELEADGGMSFRLKARMQAEQLLQTSWTLIHSPLAPPAVKADLIKFTIRAAGLDQSKEQKDQAVPPMSININL